MEKASEVPLEKNFELKPGCVTASVTAQSASPCTQHDNTSQIWGMDPDNFFGEGKDRI